MKYLRLIILLLIIYLFPTITYASGSAYVYMSSNNSTIIGSEVTISVNISNISGVEGGVSSFNGIFSYNSEYLDFISASNGSSALVCTKSNSVNKIGCLALSGATITNTANLINLKFKTKKLGNTSISLSDVKVVGKDSTTVTTTSNGKTISIVDPPTTTTTTTSNIVTTQKVTQTPTVAQNVDKSPQTVAPQAPAKQQTTQENKNSTTKKIESFVQETTRTKSSNNYLANLSVNIGILSPIFNKEKENYVVYLPFEVDKIDFSATPEDVTFAKVVIEGNDSLIIGDNIYKVKVIAENDNTRVYTINVIRNKSLEDDNSSSNTRLESLTIKNGKLKEKFNSSLHVYHYTKKNKKFAIVAKTTDKNAKVSTYSIDNIYIVMVTAQNGNKSFYILLPKRFNIIPILIVIICFLIIYIILLRNKKNREYIRKDFPIFN